MNTIQLEEECAIISLKRLNEMKDNEAKFVEYLNQNFVAYHLVDRWNPESKKVYFISSEYSGQLHHKTINRKRS